jgi:uncharacterized protein YuzE
MKITYDKDADAIYIKFKDATIAESKEDFSENIIVDYAPDYSVIGMTLLHG